MPIETGSFFDNSYDVRGRCPVPSDWDYYPWHPKDTRQSTKTEERLWARLSNEPVSSKQIEETCLS